MNHDWPLTQLGEVLTERREIPSPHDLESGRVRIVEKIAFDSGKITLRSSVSTKTGMILIYPGDLVVSGINAVKGAIAVYDQLAEETAAATIHYSAYAPDRDRIDIRFLWWMLRSQFFRDLLSEYLPCGIKTELKASRLLRVPIPLPPLGEQLQVVARIEELTAQIEEARRLHQEAVERAKVLEINVARDLYPKASGGVVGDWIRFQTGYAFKSEWFAEEGIRLARNANIGHGKLDWSEIARLPEYRLAEFLSFELHAGDILIALDRPIISTGVKVARVREEDLPCLLLQRVARARFQSEAVLPEYFFKWLRSPHFANSIDPGRSNGIPHISHKDIEKIPFTAPPMSEQRRIINMLDDFEAEVARLKALQDETAAELEALFPSILDRAFKGNL